MMGPKHAPTADHTTRREFLNAAATAVAAGALVGAVPRRAWPAGGEVDTATSELWGEAGERWSPDGRLPDFSYAGYRRGETLIPDVPVAANIRDFGALGDGEHDDTGALRRAIANTDEGAILLPAGRYRITDILEIRKGGVVLRGEGPEQTTLDCPRPLNAIRPNWGATTSGRRTSNYSWSGGIVSVRGDFQHDLLTNVTAPAVRGSQTVRAADASMLAVGQVVELHQRDQENDSLAEYLYAGQPGPTAKLNGRTRVSLAAQVIRVDGDRVTLDRPLPFDVRTQWRPRLLRFEPTVSEVGIEDLAFQFPVEPYEGHFTEVGYNALALTNVAHCWVRNVRILHCDSGIFARSRFSTFENVVFVSDREPERSRQATGHHGLSTSGHDNLFTGFDFGTRFMHDITVTSQASGNVFAAGRGKDICFDHHKRAPFANLFTDIDLGAGTRMYQCGGGADLGRNSAAWTTFWNIRAAGPQRWPPRSFGPDLMNFVAVKSEQMEVTEPDGKWFEVIDPSRVQPQNLHTAQLRRRLA